jgi:peroxiredoxin Q/BCP
MIPSQDTKAPDFTLLDQEGKAHTLSSYKGEWVLLYFYPKDNTPGCTIQACAIRDDYPAFEKLGVRVFGISADSVKSHEKFVEKFQLPFTLLSDEDKKVVTLYGVWQKKKFMGREFMGILRTSFLINPNGVIARVYEDVKAGEHAEMVLKDLRVLKNA